MMPTTADPGCPGDEPYLGPSFRWSRNGRWITPSLLFCGESPHWISGRASKWFLLVSNALTSTWTNGRRSGGGLSFR